MPTLQEILGGPQNRSAVVDACQRLIDSEMGRKRGLRAAALKAGYKVVKGLRPGFVRAACDFLLDDFCTSIDPYYQKWAGTPRASRPSLAGALQREQDQVADALLSVTDKRADRSTNRVIVKTYRRLRGVAKKHVIEALPGVGRTMEPFLKDVPEEPDAKT